MQPLNHDMDELFRKAAEDYPLKLGDGDWERVAGKLAPASSVVSPEKENKSWRKRRFVFIFLGLLLLLIGAGTLFFEQARHNGSERNNTAGPAIRDQPGTAGTGNYAAIMPPPSNRREKGYIPDKPATAHAKRFAFHQLDIQQAKASGRMNSIPAMPGPISVDTILYLPKVKSRLNVKRPKGLYIGLTGGPDFSEVKSQGLTKAGYNAGILLGYRLSNRFSIESGVLWNKKKYYSEGKYFSVSKIGSSMPAGMEIMEVEGQSSSFEFPLKVKYDLLLRSRSNWFVPAGVSTNVYIKEKNNYLTKLNGVMEHQTGLYDDLPCSWFSAVNISAGYEHVIGRSAGIRVEPYIKLPLREVGMGSMPVLSTGINVTISNLFSGHH